MPTQKSGLNSEMQYVRRQEYKQIGCCILKVCILCTEKDFFTCGIADGFFLLSVVVCCAVENHQAQAISQSV